VAPTFLLHVVFEFDYAQELIAIRPGDAKRARQRRRITASGNEVAMIAAPQRKLASGGDAAPIP